MYNLYIMYLFQTEVFLSVVNKARVVDIVAVYGEF